MTLSFFSLFFFIGNSFVLAQDIDELLVLHLHDARLRDDERRVVATGHHDTA